MVGSADLNHAGCRVRGRQPIAHSQTWPFTAVLLLLPPFRGLRREAGCRRNLSTGAQSVGEGDAWAGRRFQLSDEAAASRACPREIAGGWAKGRDIMDCEVGWERAVPGEGQSEHGRE